MDWPPKLPRGFPLTVTPRGYIARIAGRPRWVCGKRPPADALKVYHRKAAALTAGRAPLPEAKPVTGNMTLGQLLVRWLTDREADAARGELSATAYRQYRLSADRLDSVAGHHPVADLSPDVTRSIHDRLSAAHGVDFARRAIGHLRSAVRHAAEMRWCPPVLLGDKLVARLTRRPAPAMKWKLYTPAQVQTILRASAAQANSTDGRVRPIAQQLHAMILLALNGGFGAKELSDLPKHAVNLDTGVLSFVRAKTGVLHVCPLWPESVEALRPVIAQRPSDDLLFRTREGRPWCRDIVEAKGTRLGRQDSSDNVGWRFRRLAKPIGLKIPNQGFYKLRHLSLTVMDTSGDPHATFALSGHRLPGMKGHYVQIGVDRLRAVALHVRHVLLGTPPAGRRRGRAPPQPAPSP